MSDLLKQKYFLVKLRKELKERQEKLCCCYKKFGHLVQNCRNRGEKEKEKIVFQNKFKMLTSRIMQCEVEKRIIKR